MDDVLLARWAASSRASLAQHFPSVQISDRRLVNKFTNSRSFDSHPIAMTKRRQWTAIPGLLALAIGAGTEGGTHSAVRHAREAGITVKEMEHVAMLSVTTVGFPAAGRAFSWIRDTRGRSHSEIE